MGVMEGVGDSGEGGLSFIDLFAGAGGLSEGFIREGYKPITFIEKGLDACYTLKTRLSYYYLKHKGMGHIYNDYLRGLISRVELYSYIPGDLLKSVINIEISDETIDFIFREVDKLIRGGRVDIIIGGVPCQAYSLIGRNIIGERVVGDERNYLFKFFIKFLKRYEPDVFLLENVIGLLSAGGGRYLNEILNGVKSIGYSSDYGVINASDYGVLQNRRRVFIVGCKGGKRFDFSKLDKGILSGGYSLKDLFYDLPVLRAGERLKVVKYICEANECLKKSLIRDDMNFTTQHITRLVNNHDIEIYRIAINKLLREGRQLKYDELPFELQSHKNKTTFKDRFKVLDLSGLSHTLVSHLSKDGHHYIYPDIKNPRSISIRESARIQSFPDNYFFEGSMGSCFQQIGNAVPVLLAQVLARQVKEELL